MIVLIARLNSTVLFYISYYHVFSSFFSPPSCLLSKTLDLFFIPSVDLEVISSLSVLLLIAFANFNKLS